MGRAAILVLPLLVACVAPGDFDQFMLPRHIGLYAGVPLEVPALMAQRICGTGFELFRQAGEQIQGGACEAALVVGAESMTRNPIAAFDHRAGFKLGAPVGFKDYMWEALKDPAAGVNMIQTAENLARKYGITREAVDEFASASFARAVAAQESGFLAGEIASSLIYRGDREAEFEVHALLDAGSGGCEEGALLALRGLMRDLEPGQVLEVRSTDPVNGSDYPLPAINALIWTRSFVRNGFITAEERRALNEIYDYNPLLFDFVLKRTMRHPETGQKLGPSVFMANPGLE